MIAEPLLNALKRLRSVLQKQGVPAAVMGGLAMAAWQRLRATQDVDLLIWLGSGDPRELIAALEAAGFRPKHDPPLRRLGETDLLQLLSARAGEVLEIQVDLLAGRNPYHRQILERSVEVALDESGESFRVVALEDRILLKLQAGRIIDQADVVGLLQANRQTLDPLALARASETLRVRADLEGAWNEAFPGEPFPL